MVSEGSNGSKRARLTLVAGGSYLEREKWIATALSAHPDQVNAVILEGLPTGNAILQTHHQIRIARIASGCFCCSGQLVMTVNLNRLLRQHPHHVYIGMIETQHVNNLRDLLRNPPYQNWLVIEKVVQLP